MVKGNKAASTKGKTVRIAAMTVSVPPRTGGKVRGEEKPAKGKKGK